MVSSSAPRRSSLTDAAALTDALGASSSGSVVADIGPRPSDLTVRLGRADDLPAAAAVLTGPHAMTLATLVATDDTMSPDADFKVRYIFEPTLPGVPDQFVTLLTSVDPARPEVPSLTAAIPAANWHEREMRDLFGIVPIGHPDPRPLVVHDGWPQGVFPLRKTFDGSQRVPVEPAAEFPHLVAEGEGVFEIPVGPIHAGIIEPGHFRFSSVGERILHLDAFLFFTHRGIEKLVEGRQFEAAMPVIERACGVCTVTHAMAFAQAVESLTATQIPDRAAWARVVVAELERTYNHVSDLGNICAGIGFHSGTSRLAALKERLLRLNEELTGHRYLMGIIGLGGLRADLDPSGLERVTAELPMLDRELAAAVRAVIRSDGVRNRTHGTGIVSRTMAESLGATGVAAKACGFDRDLRRDEPYARYGELRVEPTVGAAGDVAARFDVRAREAHDSIRLVLEAIAALPGGGVRTELSIMPAAGLSTISGVEGPRGTSRLWLRAGPDGTVDRVHLRSASFANWPVVAAAVPGDLVPDFPLINKSFELCYACTDR